MPLAAQPGGKALEIPTSDASGPSETGDLFPQMPNLTLMHDITGNIIILRSKKYWASLSATAAEG
jgi:hypothetical protein